MGDSFSNYQTGLSDVASNAAAVVPNDGQDLGTVSRALYVGGTGDIVVDMAGGGTVTFPAAQGWMSLRVKRVRATGTTATGIVAVW